MKYDLAVVAVPLLEDALGNVLGASSWIAPVSLAESETYADVLTDARLGIYEILSRIRAMHPTLELVPEDTAEEWSAEPDWAPDPRAIDRPLDHETVIRVRTSLRDASLLLDRVDALIAQAGEGALSETEFAFLQTHFSNARKAIENATLRLSKPL